MIGVKRYGNLYPKICEITNLYRAHKKARQDKLFYKEVQMVDAEPAKYMMAIQEMLANKTYEVSNYEYKRIVDKGKERELMKLPYFPDRIIQWAIMLVLEPIFIETLCDHVCASVKGRGITRATKLTERYIYEDPEGTKYCLKLDISKFYPNVDHAILKNLLRRKIKDPDTLELLDKIIDSYPGEKGVPIGSYLSQFLANYYLAYFDHWLKEDCHEKYVVRYMDDVVIFGSSKEHLHRRLKEIQTYLSENLNLQVKGNWQVFQTAERGVDFVGYRHFPEYQLMRKGSFKRLKRKMLDIRKKWESGQRISRSEFCAINSYTGFLKWCDSWRAYEKYIEPVIPAAHDFYMNVIHANTRGKSRSKAERKFNRSFAKRKGKDRHARHGNRTRLRGAGTAIDCGDGYSIPTFSDLGVYGREWDADVSVQ